MSEIQARISWQNKYCRVLTDNPDEIECIFCKKIYLKLHRDYFTKHLHDKHQISELDEHPNRGFLEKFFIISVEMEKGRCIKCTKLISYEKRGLYLLENHYEMFHGDNVKLFKMVVNSENGKEILNHFFLLKSKKAACTSCELKINIEHLDALTAETLTKLAEHYFSHDRETFSEEFRKNYLDDLTKQLVRQDKGESHRRMFLESVLIEPGPSTSSSTAVDKTERSEQSEVQNIPKSSKSSTLETQLKQKKDDRTPWENKYYEVLTDNRYKCIFCKNVYLKSPSFDLAKHLYEHGISEVTYHQHRGFLENSFIISVEKEESWCKGCMSFIPFGKRGMYILENHYEMFHSNNANLFYMVSKGKNGREILNKFRLMGKNAACISCELLIDIEQLNVHSADTLIKLAEHYFSHDRSTFPEECQEDYFKELEDELNKQLQIEFEVGQRKYQVTPPEPVFNEPSTSSSTAVYRTERSEQSDVQNIPTRSKSSTLDEPQLKQKEDARIPWQNKYCKVLTDNPDEIECILCKKNYLKLHRDYFTKHLYDKHQISELDEHPNREFLEKFFIISVEIEKGRCINCKTFISYEKRGLYLLENHYEMFHSNNAKIFDTVLKIQSGEEILNNFILLKSKKAACRSCELKINIEHIDALTADTLTELAEHYFSHARETFSEEFRKNYLDDIVVQLVRRQNEVIELMERQCRRTLPESVLNEPGPSTSSSTAVDRTERSKQSEVQNIPMKRSKSSTSETQVKKRKKDE